WPLPDHTTAMAELLRTLHWMGGYAKPELPFLKGLEKEPSLGSKARALLPGTIAAIEADERENDGACCVSPFTTPRTRLLPAGRAVQQLRKKVGSIGFEDQDERPVVYDDFFAQKPTVVVFFYTRCDNYNKCSLTITRLGQLQRAIQSSGLEGAVRTA